MCGSKGSTVSSTSGPPSEFLAAYKDTYNQARDLTTQPYSAYTGSLVAGFTPDQYSAFGTVRNTQGLAQPYYNQAASYFTTSAEPISPYAFEGLSTLPSKGLGYYDTAGDWATSATAPTSLMEYDISPYESPYTTNVTNALSDLYAENNARQYEKIRGNAAATGAFGGDREAIAEAETARQQKLAQDPILAEVQQTGFKTAQDEFNTQQQIDLESQLADRKYLLGAGELGLGVGKGLWGQFNTQQDADLRAQLGTANLQQGAGYGVGSLGTSAQASALTGANALLTTGGMGQSQEQQLLNVPYYQWLAQQAYPYQQTGWLSNIATGLGGASGGTASTTYPGPSTLSQVAGLGSLGLGVYGVGKDAGWWGGGGGGSSWTDYTSTSGLSSWGDVGSGWDSVIGSGWWADGGAVGLARGGVPPEFGGDDIPMPGSYIPGARGMGAEPASKGGSGLSKMFMQPVTTTTQESGGGGGLGSILGLALKAAPLFLDDGGAVPPRAPGHKAAPIVTDLTSVLAPSSYGPATAASMRPATNFAPTFDSQGYPGAMQAVPNNWVAPTPLQIPMNKGRLDRAALNPIVSAPATATVPDLGLSAPDMGLTGLTTYPELGFLGMSTAELSQGDADGGRVGYDSGGGVMPGLSYIPQLPMMNPGTMGPPKPPTMQGTKPQSTNDALLGLIKSAKNILSESLGGAVEPQGLGASYDDGGSVGGVGEMNPAATQQQRALLQQYQNLPITKLRELSLRYPPYTPQGQAVQRAILMKHMMPMAGGAGLGGYGGGAEAQAANGGRMGLARGGFDPSLEEGAAIDRRPSLEELAGLDLPFRTVDSILFRPSYAEGDAMPLYDAPRAAAFDAESNASALSRMGFGRDDLLLDALSRPRAWDLRDGGQADDDWLEPPPKDWRPGDPIKRPTEPRRGLAVGGDPEDADLIGTPFRDPGIPAEVDTALQSGLAIPLDSPSAIPPWIKRNSRGEAYNLDAAPGEQISAAQVTPRRMRDLAAANASPRAEGLAAAPQSGVPVDRTNGIVPIGVPRGTDNAMRANVVQFWANAGVPLHVAEGIADRVNAESGFKSGIYGDNGTSAGLYQHHAGRLAGLQRFAAAQGKDWRDPNVQNQFALTEVQGGDPIAAANWEKIKNAPDRQTAAMLWDKYFERSKYGPGAGARTLVSGLDRNFRAEIPGSGGGMGAPQGLSQAPAMGTAEPREKSDLQKMMSSPWMALVGAGAGMLASRSPYPGVAIGEGIQTGLKLAGSMADRANKEELTDIRAQSADAQAKNLAERARLVQERQAETASNNAARQAQASENAALRAAADADRSKNAEERLRQTGEIEAGRAAAREKERERREERDKASAAMAEKEHERKKLADELRQARPTVFDRKMQAAKDAGMSETEALAYANGQRPMSEQHIARAAAQHARKEFDNISQDYLNPQREQFIKMSPAQKDSWLQKRGAFWQQQIRSGFGGVPATAPAGQPAAAPASSAPPAGPPPGTTVGGYRFKGGNPNDRSNWEPVQ